MSAAFPGGATVGVSEMAVCPPFARLMIEVVVKLERWRPPPGRNGRERPDDPFDEESSEQFCSSIGEAQALLWGWLSKDGEDGWSHSASLYLDNQGGG